MFFLPPVPPFVPERLCNASTRFTCDRHRSAYTGRSSLHTGRWRHGPQLCRLPPLTSPDPHRGFLWAGAPAGTVTHPTVLVWNVVVLGLSLHRDPDCGRRRGAYPQGMSASPPQSVILRSPIAPTRLHTIHATMLLIVFKPSLPTVGSGGSIAARFRVSSTSCADSLSNDCSASSNATMSVVAAAPFPNAVVAVTSVTLGVDSLRSSARRRRPRLRIFPIPSPK